jgi:hypothetical protein
VGWSGNGLRVLGITLMPPSGNPRPSRCAALAAKIEKLSQTVRPSLGWDKDSKCGPSSPRHCSAWTRRITLKESNTKSRMASAGGSGCAGAVQPGQLILDLLIAVMANVAAQWLGRLPAALPETGA